MAFPGGKSLSSNWNDTLGEGGVNGRVFERVPGERCEPTGEGGREGGREGGGEGGGGGEREGGE